MSYLRYIASTLLHFSTLHTIKLYTRLGCSSAASGLKRSCDAVDETLLHPSCLGFNLVFCLV